MTLRQTAHKKGVVTLADYVTLELDAGQKGWRCSGCGLFVDCLGRPIFGSETWTIETKSLSWLENKPNFIYCPKCGKKLKSSPQNVKQQMGE